jgi:sugar/nucleoside kinase (ribokinase family)
MLKSNTRIALLGTINRDTIHTPDGVTTESYGGLLYSILALAEIASPEASIYPICNVGADMESVVREKLAPYPQVKFDGITFVPGKNPHCFLEYNTEGHKQETLQNDVPQITFAQIQPFLDCDAICFNFITGMELALETAEQVRKAAKGLLLMDVHSLTLGMDENRRRFWRVPPEWERWVGCVDVVQMNEQEGALLADESLAEDQATLRFAEKVLTLGPTTLMLTRNVRGSQTFCQNADGTLQVKWYAPVPVGEPQDETGCGDTFLMGFTWAFLQSNNQDIACQFANRVAGINVCLRGIDGISQIGQFLKPEERALGLADD